MILQVTAGSPPGGLWHVWRNRNHRARSRSRRDRPDRTARREGRARRRGHRTDRGVAPSGRGYRPPRRARLWRDEQRRRQDRRDARSRARRRIQPAPAADPQYGPWTARLARGRQGDDGGASERDGERLSRRPALARRPVGRGAEQRQAHRGAPLGLDGRKRHVADLGPRPRTLPGSRLRRRRSPCPAEFERAFARHGGDGAARSRPPAARRHPGRRAQHGRVRGEPVGRLGGGAGLASVRRRAPPWRRDPALSSGQLPDQDRRTSASSGSAELPFAAAHPWRRGRQPRFRRAAGRYRIARQPEQSGGRDRAGPVGLGRQFRHGGAVDGPRRGAARLLARRHQLDRAPRQAGRLVLVGASASA